MSPPAFTPHPQARAGAVAAASCYFLWGLVPLYWKHLGAIDAVELISHRHLWSLVLLLALLAAHGAFAGLGAAFRDARTFGRLLLGALLLTANWLVYVWGVNAGHVIETSLGYFLVPLFNVAAGRWLLHEHLRRTQWIAIGLAATGVALLILQVGRPPWIALTLAATWGGYSLLRKQSTLAAVPGLAAETLVLAPFALAFLGWRHAAGTGALGRVDLPTHLLIVSSGLVTAVPLLLFAYGAKRVRLSTLGLLQYLAPTVQLGLGIWVYHEPFSRARLASFGFIWAALLLYTADNFLAQSRR